jgi:transposase
MRQPTVKKYPAAWKERAVTLAVAADQPLAQTARELGSNDKPLHPWIGTDHRLERQPQQVHDAHLDEALQRLRQAHTRLQEERES